MAGLCLLLWVAAFPAEPLLLRSLLVSHLIRVRVMCAVLGMLQQLPETYFAQMRAWKVALQLRTLALCVAVVEAGAVYHYLESSSSLAPLMAGGQRLKQMKAAEQEA